jgi:3-phosphoshikimate 1-carboxyvinyltransferase
MRLEKIGEVLDAEIFLDGSKSISNRLLIIQALCEETILIDHISTSDDTRILQDLLHQKENQNYNVGSAGTAFRFLTAYFAFKEGTQTITGSERLKNRPIGTLVAALNTIGANIEYLEKEGFAPLSIKSPKNKILESVQLDGSISSQFISALCLVAPILPNGLSIKLENNLVSKSYILLTLQMMQHFGVQSVFKENVINISNQKYLGKSYYVESDWSAAAYYYCIVALAKTAKIKLNGLHNSIQGDAVLTTLFTQFGVKTTFVEKGIIIEKTENINPPIFEYNFIDCPDIAQPLIVLCAAKGIQSLVSGIETLKVKETDRIQALKTELGKTGVSFVKLPPHFSKKSNTPVYLLEGKCSFENLLPFDTYDDHRMAMSLSLLTMISAIEINNPEVISKSYPNFWQDLMELRNT